MSQPSCAGSLQACALRIAKLQSSDGVPLPGTGNLYVTNQLVEITVEPEISTGEDFEQKNGCGDIIVALKDRDRIKRMNVTMQLGFPDPEITKLLIGGDTITSGGNVIGYLFPEIGVQPDVFASIEFWTKRVGPGGQASDYPYWRWILPKTQWTIGSRTWGNEVLVTNFTGFAQENSNWYNGPNNDFPHTSNRVMMYRMETSIPTTSCGAQNLASS